MLQHPIPDVSKLRQPREEIEVHFPLLHSKQNMVSNAHSRIQVPRSFGIGGAGNIGSSMHDTDPVDLNTPTLKSEVYTTGRGGSGNMAKNTDPEDARRAQDVVAHPRQESVTDTHVGRGGAANIFKPSDEDVALVKKNHGLWEAPVRGGNDENNNSEKGLADKGKNWLFAMLKKPSS